MTLAEAHRQVHLEPGRTYRERVDGMTVEVRLIPEPTLPDPPPGEFADRVMTDPPGEMPWSPVVVVRADYSPTGTMPDPPLLPPDDGAES
jgi:hypothetical protein